MQCMIGDKEAWYDVGQFLCDPGRPRTWICDSQLHVYSQHVQIVNMDVTHRSSQQSSGSRCTVYNACIRSTEQNKSGVWKFKIRPIENKRKQV